jgi:hypothetical protein
MQPLKPAQFTTMNAFDLHDPFGMNCYRDEELREQIQVTAAQSKKRRKSVLQEVAGLSIRVRVSG